MLTLEQAKEKLGNDITEKEYHYARHLTDREMGIVTLESWLKIFTANFNFVRKNKLAEE